jgi:type IV pilus assembly protein PilQ
MRALPAIAATAVVVVAAAGPPRADRELCGPHARYRGATIELDLKAADVHDVFRLLSDVGHVNIVLPGTLKARVTLRVKRVPWDQVACAIAAIHHLAIRVDGNVLVVTPRQAATGLRRP